MDKTKEISQEILNDISIMLSKYFTKKTNENEDYAISHIILFCVEDRKTGKANQEIYGICDNRNCENCFKEQVRDAKIISEITIIGDEIKREKE